MSNVSKKDDTLDWIKGTEKQLADADEDVSGDIVLKGALGIAEAEAMHHRLSRVLDANVDISIQSEDLSRVDAAGAQLLYALVKEAKSRSVSLKWESVSDALQETTDMLGLSEGMGFAADA